MGRILYFYTHEQNILDQPSNVISVSFHGKIKEKRLDP